jgi:hypothetical protein
MYKTPQAMWFRERAEQWREQAKLRISVQQESLRLASAYERLALAIEHGEEIRARFLQRYGTPPSSPPPSSESDG